MAIIFVIIILTITMIIIIILTFSKVVIELNSSHTDLSSFYNNQRFDKRQENIESDNERKN